MNSELSFKHKLTRLLFGIVWGLTCRPFPRSLGAGYRRMILRLFGANISSKTLVYSSAKIYYPKNLKTEGECVIGPNTNIYNVDMIIIKDGAIVSQGAYLCTASHDITQPSFNLISAPIMLCEKSWVCADAFVGMGVTIGEGGVVGARAAVFKDVDPWTVWGGCPAKMLKQRIMSIDGEVN